MSARLAPNATCSLTGSSAADVKGFVWFGLVAPDDAEACAVFYAGCANTGVYLWAMAASRSTSVGPVGPFRTSDCAVYCALAGTNASALISTASF